MLVYREGSNGSTGKVPCSGVPVSSLPPCLSPADQAAHSKANATEPLRLEWEGRNVRRRRERGERASD